MTISIVIPVYNVAKYLKQGLDSITTQTYSDLDIVCVDDCSEDGSDIILSQYATSDKRFRIISQDQNKGTYIARQKAVAMAKGEYILFFDPDDWLERNACEQIALFVKANKDCDIVQYDAIIESDNISDNAKWIEGYLNTKIDKLSGSETMWKECFEKQQISWNLIGKVIRTSVAKRAFALQEPVVFSTLTDYFASYYVYGCSKNLFHLPLKLYHYRYGQGVSTKPNVGLHDYKLSLRNIEAFKSVSIFLKNKSSSSFEQKIINEIMYNYTMDNSLYYALYRLDGSTPPIDWINAFIKAAGLNNAMHAIGKKLKELKSLVEGQKEHAEWLNKELKRTNLETKYLKESFLEANQHSIKLSAKNQKHLRQIRIMIPTLCLETLLLLFLLLLYLL